jgi:hypothetical protein
VSDFMRWIEDFVVAGNRSKAHEKDATIHYLAPNLRDEIGSLTISSTGIFRMDHEPQIAGVTRTTHVKFSMYAEQVRCATAAEPAVAPAAPTTQRSPHRNVRDVLGKRLAPAEVLRRLQEEPAAEQSPDGAESQRMLGRDVGLAWAQRHASLTELRGVAAADDRDWSSISLPEGHSLAETLAATIDTPLLDDGSLELPRDALVEGLLSGVLEVLAELNVHIDAEKSTTQSPSFRALSPEQQRDIARNTT